jgi:hypothetical protein
MSRSFLSPSGLTRGPTPRDQRRRLSGGVGPRVEPEDDSLRRAAPSRGRKRSSLRPTSVSPSDLSSPSPPGLTRGPTPHDQRRRPAGGVGPPVEPEDDSPWRAAPPSRGRKRSSLRPTSGSPTELSSPSPSGLTRGPTPGDQRRRSAGGVGPRVEPEHDSPWRAAPETAPPSRGRQTPPPCPSSPSDVSSPSPSGLTRGPTPDDQRRRAAGGVGPRVEPEDDSRRRAAERERRC